MVDDGHFAISLFDFDIGRRGLNAQGIVVRRVDDHGACEADLWSRKVVWERRVVSVSGNLAVLPSLGEVELVALLCPAGAS